MLTLIPQSEVKSAEEFLTPISAEDPTGPYIRRDPVLNRLKELRAISLDISSGLWKTKEKQGDTVAESIQLSEEFLKTTSKDLFVAIYYTEALTKKYGFFGLEQGLSVIEAFCDTYWDKFNPGLDEDQAPMRITALKLLQTILNERLNLAPIVVTDTQQYTAFDILKKEKGHEPTKVKNTIISYLAGENSDSLKTFKEKLQHSIKILNDLSVRSEELDTLLETEEAPNFSKQVDVLKVVLELVNSALNPAALQIVPQSTTEANASQGLQTNATGELSMKADFSFPENPIKSIQDAYQMIGKINEFLLKNDSHSPCPALIQRAIEWRNKPLFELYADIFAGLSRPDELFTLLAIKPKPQPPQVPQVAPNAPNSPSSGLPPSPAPNYGSAYPPSTAGGYGSSYGGAAGYQSPYGGSTTPGTTPGGYGGTNPYGGNDLGGGYPPTTPGGYNPYGSGRGGSGFGGDFG